MRIIAGEYRGRKILPPLGEVTRPITDRVKQSLFDILAPSLPEARVYDLFAGTGSLGLEALSRGAARVSFFESDRSARQRLAQNLTDLEIDRSRAAIEAGDLFAWFADAARGDGGVNIVFLDPPYRFVNQQPIELRRLAQRLADHHLAAGAIVVFRHDAADELELAALRRYDQRTYGGMMLEFLCPHPNTNSSNPATPLG